MRTVILMTLLVAMAGSAFGQSTPSALSTDPQQIQNLIEQTGCRFEVNAAAQTIANLQKQVNDLQKQLAAAKDPPKSGASRK